MKNPVQSDIQIVPNADALCRARLRKSCLVRKPQCERKGHLRSSCLVVSTPKSLYALLADDASGGRSAVGEGALLLG